MENLLMYGIFGLFALIIALIVWIASLGRKIKKMTAGKTVASLESVIIETNDMVTDLKEKNKNHQLHITALRNELARTIQNIPVIRFDALKEMGGMQSFAIGFLDSHKNGVVISSMYTRDRMNVFAKEIIKGESKHTLTAEEQKIINL